MTNPLNTNSNQFDVIVIGSGPGGEGAAINAAKNGKSVLVVERRAEVGGNCTHTATIPSKALRSTISEMLSLTSKPLFQELIKPGRLSFQELLKGAHSVTSKQVNVRRAFYERNNVRMIHGQARFIDAHTLEVEHGEGARDRFQGSHFVIASGSRPYHPPDIDFTHPRIFDSDTLLQLSFTPQSITIYGAGVIGCEYTSMLRNLGLKTNLINTRAKLLEFLDDEIVDALAYHLREQGVVIRHDEEYEKVVGTSDGVILHLKSGKKIKTDILLWANGRTGNSNDIGLEAVGIKPDSRGLIKTNQFYQTNVENIYAVGDVVGFPALASASFDQGRIAVSHLIRGTSAHLVEFIPTGIYTAPEISSVGYTERELTSKAIPYEIGHAFFRNLARAQISGQTVGMLKILFHRETLEILGIHCFGDQASEIIHIGQAIMSQKGEGNTLMYFVNTTFNYPTMAEAYRVAALNGINRVCKD
jgi:NAD(P) transhydrogenase